LDEISIPTLIAHGTADRVLPVENGDLLAELLPNAELELIDGGPHLFFIEQADAVNERLRTFIDDA
ncbi:alpha/beta fold hydrolase, partial [Haladaptatus sp.]|uniref:alpha/beta fold hydrolase n=1 Tax=Haladaptatus sp. TaxID=1973141 RepID=UPI003C663F6B